MPASKPLETVVATFRLTAEEKARWDAYCRAHDVTLSQAIRGGLKLYEQEMLDVARDRDRRRQAKRGKLSL